MVTDGFQFPVPTDFHVFFEYLRSEYRFAPPQQSTLVGQRIVPCLHRLHGFQQQVRPFLHQFVMQFSGGHLLADFHLFLKNNIAGIYLLL